MSCRAVEILGSGSWPGSGLYTPRHRIMLLLLHFEWPDWRKYRQATGKSNLADRRQPASPCRTNEERGHIDPLEPRCFLPFPGPLTTIILLLVYGLCILKLSGVLCLQKVIDKWGSLRVMNHSIRDDRTEGGGRSSAPLPEVRTTTTWSKEQWHKMNPTKAPQCSSSIGSSTKGREGGFTGIAHCGSSGKKKWESGW